MTPHPAPPRDHPPLDRGQRLWIRSLVIRSGVPEPDIDDVTQNVLLAVRDGGPATVPEGLLPGQAWRAWCRGVVRIQVKSYRREIAKQAAAALGAAPELVSAQGEPSSLAPAADDVLIARAEQALARAALEELRARHPERHVVLVGHDIDERPLREVAAGLGITTNTAWNRLRLAREELRATLARWAAVEQGREAARRLTARDRCPRS